MVDRPPALIISMIMAVLCNGIMARPSSVLVRNGMGDISCANGRGVCQPTIEPCDGTTTSDPACGSWNCCESNSPSPDPPPPSPPSPNPPPPSPPSPNPPPPSPPSPNPPPPPGPQPGPGDSCDFGKGTCIDTDKSSCDDGHLIPGICPGPSNVECCVQDGPNPPPPSPPSPNPPPPSPPSPNPPPPPGPGVSCDFGKGTCIDTGSGCSGHFIPGICPGGSNIECCVPDSPSPPSPPSPNPPPPSPPSPNPPPPSPPSPNPPPPSPPSPNPPPPPGPGVSCDFGRGTCIDTGSGCSGHFIPGICPGGSNIECCVPDSPSPPSPPSPNPPPSPGPSGCSHMSSISGSQLQCVFTRLSSSEASNYAVMLSGKMGGLLSNTCEWAAFLGNVGTESAGLTEWTQVPCDSSDDAPYCGRGPLQITGIDNYKFCAGEGVCGCSGIVNDPQQASSGYAGVGTAACVWGALSGHNLSEDADGTTTGLLKTACYINAGHYPCGNPNGWESRQSYWHTANSCLN